MDHIWIRRASDDFCINCLETPATVSASGCPYSTTHTWVTSGNIATCSVCAMTGGEYISTGSPPCTQTHPGPGGNSQQPNPTATGARGTLTINGVPVSTVQNVTYNVQLPAAIPFIHFSYVIPNFTAPKCECGAKSINFSYHSTWCPLYVK